MLPSSSRNEERGRASRNRYAVGVVLLIMTVLASGDLLEVVPGFAALVRHPLFPFYHEAHDLLALLVALYAAHRLGSTIGRWAVVWFLALHVPYFYLTLPTELPEFARFALLALVAFFSVHILTQHHRLEGQLNSLAVTLETQRAAEARRAQEADTLRQAGAAVAATLRPDETIARILLQLERVVPYDSASVLLWIEAPDRPGEGQLEIVGGRGWSDPAVVVGLRFPVPGDNPNTVVIQQRRPYILGDAPTAHAPFREDPHSHIRSWLGVPLIVRERVIGMLAVDSAQPDYFTPDHARLVSAFADQVAIAIENARLVEAERKRLEELTVLYALATIGVEATDVDALVAHAIQIIGDILHPDYFGVGLIDEGAGVLRVCRSGRSALMERITVPLGRGVAGQVVATGAPRRIPDVSREPLYLSVNPETRSELCVPLVGAQGRDVPSNFPAPLPGQRVIGVINIESTRRNAFAEADERLMTAFAGQLATAIEKVRLYAEAQRRADQLRALHEAGRALASDLRLESILHTVIETAQRLTDARYGSLTVLDAEGRPAHFYAIGVTEAERARIGEPPRGRGLLGVVLREGKPMRVDDLARDPRTAGFPPHHPPMRSLLGMPIVARGKAIGGLYLTDKANDQPFTQEDEDLVTRLAADAAIAIENARLFEEVQQLAVTDELTGLHNRRSFFEMAGHEFERARRYGRPLSALMLDIDHFKRVNDTYGHAVGDQVLRALARRCREHLREIDLLGRYGGEEFAVLLPESDANSARNAAERLRRCVAEAPMDTTRGPLAITISLGAAALTEACPDLAALLDRADAALYAAKKAGRNRVEIMK
jgi:diguanylate cyclase (GGDEF)-like protein